MVLNIRQSERTTAEEVRLTQLELEQQLGGMFSLLTDEFLKPYLERTLMVLQRSNQLPKLPKGIVSPEIVAGVNALGRGQDRESLIQFITTISQTMGPETLAKFINPDEYIKRLAAAQGIDYLNLVKSVSDVQGETATAASTRCTAQMEWIKQVSLHSAPMMDPSKNPNAQEMYDGITGQANPEASRSRRSRRQVEAPRTSKEGLHPPTEKPVLKVEEPEPNKYAPKPKVGTPNLGSFT